MKTPRFISLYLFISDLPKTVEFYEKLGLEVEQVSGLFARASVGKDILFEFGTAELTRSYDKGWNPPGGPTQSTINLGLDSRSAVDETYARMVGSGYVGHLAPCDPPWGARFAILEDPDRNYVGLHSPREVGSDREREAGAAES